ncbi:MAG TPA: DegQ family serine endoprotease [Terriglobia bacterium]|nr:DegQ family serine endoprotease [Terriglobia bacterium]
MHNRIQTPTWVAAAALGLALIVGGLTGSVVQSSSEQPTYTVASGARTQIVFDQGFSPVVKSAAPAVVNISSSRVVRAPEGNPLGPADESILRRFFGEDFMRQFRIPRERREHSLGSGVIVNSNGYILTNSHVVMGATNVKVALSDRREMPGKIIGVDPGTDIAVVKIDTDHLSVLPFGDSSKVEVGDIALALGNPFGLGRTVTMGIVSATGRGGLGIEDYEDFIQTDASINPGNSGGALINVRGELIGVNTAILSPSGGSLGIGFAVPSNMVRTVMDQIVKTGKVTRGYIGVSVQDITPELAAAMKIPQTRGALIGDLDPKGPAAQNGLQSGDVIVEADGKAIEDSRMLRLIVGSKAPGTQLSLGVLRNGQPRNVTVKLDQLPVKETASTETPTRQKGSAPETIQSRIGVAAVELTPEIAQHLKVPDDVKGVVVADVEEGSPAAEAGLQLGDVVQEVNHKPVHTVADFYSQLTAARGSNPILLLLNRDGHTLYAAIDVR